MRVASIRVLGCTLLTAGLLGAALLMSAGPDEITNTVYLEGVAAPLRFIRPEGAKAPYQLGPWRVGFPSQRTPPKDGRLNLYVAVPGDQYQNEAHHSYDHSLIVNALPGERELAEYDVYWAITIDPGLRSGFTSEHKILIAAQARFTPKDLFEFDDMPGAPFLRAMLKVDSIQQMKRYQNKNGALPQLLIVPAGFSVRAYAVR